MSVVTLVDRIIEFENGDMSQEDTIAFFQDLVDTGLAWKLQGSYGRMANALIKDGLVEFRHFYHPVGVPCEKCSDSNALFVVVHATAPCPVCTAEMLPIGVRALKCPNCNLTSDVDA